MLNFNVGVLGHVDSGKMSLSKALSTVASTTSFDKNPQSKESGITLDLGFSSFTVDIPEHYQTYLFLESTGIAHTVCNKLKKVICMSCNDKHCEGVIKLKDSLKASQEASLKEVELEGSTQQIEEAENADKQKLSDYLIKPNYPH